MKLLNKVEVGYSIRDINKPIRISEYILTQALPENFKSNLPTVEQLENQLSEEECEEIYYWTVY